MNSDSNAPATDAIAADPEHSRRAALCPSQQADAVTYDWTQIGIGTVVAGGVYPIVLTSISTLYLIASTVWYGLAGNRPSNLAEGAMYMTMYAAVGGMFGLLWSLLVAALTLPIVYFVAMSLGLRTSVVRLGAFSGGLVGFICTLPISLQVPWYTFPSDLWALALFSVAGPGLATLLGQLGGAWGGRHSRAAGPKVPAWKKSALESEVLPSPTAEHSEIQEQASVKFQFGIRHLLWVSVWLSLLLALIRLCRIPYELMLPLLVGWTAYQFATMWIGERLARRLGPWWTQRRQLRST